MSMLGVNLNVIILAAGRGCRMRSNIPKVLHKIGGKSILQHLIDSVVRIEDVKSVYIVYGYKGDMIKKEINIDKYSDIFVNWILQRELLGTGHAVQQVLSILNDKEEVLVLCGDVPFISCKTLQKLRMIKSQCDISMLTAILPNPNGYGRIIRNQENNVISIVEHNNIVNDDHKKIKEINTGIFVTVVSQLKYWLNMIDIDKSKNELYLTDVIQVAYQSGCVIHTIYPDDIFEVLGVNSKSDLVFLDRQYQLRQAKYLLSSGVIISDPNRFDLRGTLVHGKDVFIDINVIIEGYVYLGNRVQIGANCILKNSIIEDDVVVYPFSIVDNAKINSKTSIGSFVRLRPGTELKEGSYVGNFVEIKNTLLGKQSKVKHLSYLGDATIGNQVNIGAGTIICNYDGIKKNNTIIGDNVLIGADSQLVAPIIIEKNATIGAGTTVTRDVAESDTVISRIKQFSILKKKK